MPDLTGGPPDGPTGEPPATPGSASRPRRPGGRLRLTRRRAAASGLHPVDTSGAPALSYRVRDGDTVSSIAARSGSSVRAVLAANGLRPNRKIMPGQLLVLPALRTVSTAATRRPRR